MPWLNKNLDKPSLISNTNIEFSQPSHFDTYWYNLEWEHIYNNNNNNNISTLYIVAIYFIKT